MRFDLNPKVTLRKARGKKSARLLVRCSDCPNKVEIHFDKDEFGDSGAWIEIGGVIASRREWRAILKKVGL